MGRGKRAAQDELERRAELGGYSDAEFDKEFARSHRSDPLSIAIRVLTLVLVYAVLARAIRLHDPPPWLLVLPIAFEFLVIFWVGWVLSRFIVPCKTFAKSAGSLPLAVVWTVVICAGMAAAIVFNPGGARPPDSAELALREAWSWVTRTDLHWALLAMVAALLMSTAQEVLRWQRERGVFVWASIMNTGFRIGVMFLMGFLGIFVVAFLGEFLLTLAAEVFMRFGGRPLTWAIYSFLVLAEVLTLVISTMMHRETLAKHGKGGARRAKEKTGLP
jgi:hypothetical protein